MDYFKLFKVGDFKWLENKVSNLIELKKLEDEVRKFNEDFPLNGKPTVSKNNTLIKACIDPVDNDVYKLNPQKDEIFEIKVPQKDESKIKISQ